MTDSDLVVSIRNAVADAREHVDDAQGMAGQLSGSSESTRSTVELATRKADAVLSELDVQLQSNHEQRRHQLERLRGDLQADLADELLTNWPALRARLHELHPGVFPAPPGRAP